MWKMSAALFLFVVLCVFSSRMLSLCLFGVLIWSCRARGEEAVLEEEEEEGVGDFELEQVGSCCVRIFSPRWIVQERDV